MVRTTDGSAEETSGAFRLVSGKAIWRRLARLLADRQYRYAFLMRRGLVKDAFQPENRTRDGRYSIIFKFVQSVLGENSQPALLSFGCSTGEEVFNLCRRFPGATVRGLDINPGNIDACDRRLRGAGLTNVSFARASSTGAEPEGHYDCIFCMAVLRDGRLNLTRPDDCSPVIRFEVFAALVEDFHKRLKPGGLLVIRHSNFRLRDTAIANRFEVLLSLATPPYATSPIYGPDNRLAPDQSYPDAVFRKIA